MDPRENAKGLLQLALIRLLIIRNSTKPTLATDLTVTENPVPDIHINTASSTIGARTRSDLPARSTDSRGQVNRVNEASAVSSVSPGQESTDDSVIHIDSPAHAHATEAIDVDDQPVDKSAILPASPSDRATKVIGKGAYGCVLRSAIKCPLTQSTKNTISKVFKSEEDMEHEREINEIIQEVDPNGQFTVKYVDSCEIEHTAFEMHKRDCGFGDKSKKHPQIIFADGGDDLDTAVKNVQFETLFKSLSSAFIGLDALHKKEIVHADIKPANMVYNDDTHKLAIIDFGLACKFDEFDSKMGDMCYHHPYAIYPPEFPLLANRHNYKKCDECQNYTLLWYRVNPLLSGISSRPDCMIMHKEVVEFEKLFKSEIGHSSKLRCPDKIDVYSLGASILILLADSYSNKHAIITTSNVPYYAGVLQLCRKMLHNVPEARITAESALAEYNKITNPTPTTTGGNSSVQQIHELHRKAIDLMKQNPNPNITIKSNQGNTDKWIEKTIRETRCVIFRTPSCPYCIGADIILNAYKIPFTAFDITGISPADEKILINLANNPVRLTVPQIFIDNKYIGGYTELCMKFFRVNVHHDKIAEYLRNTPASNVNF